MRKTFIRWIAVTVPLLAGVLMVLLVGRRDHRWHASPVAMRNPAEWSNLFPREPRPEPSPPFRHAPVTIQRIPEDAAPKELSFEFDDDRQDRLSLPGLRADANGEILTPDGAVFRLEAVAVSIPTLASVERGWTGFPAEWINPYTGEPAGVEPLQAQQDLFFYRRNRVIARPKSKIVIRLEEVANPVWDVAHLFSADHRGRVARITGIHRPDGMLVLRGELDQWHNSPFIRILDVSHGPFEKRTLMTKPGSVALFGAFEVRSVHVEDRVWKYSYQYNKRTPIRLKFGRANESRPGHFLGVSVSPREYLRGCEFAMPAGDQSVDWPRSHYDRGIGGLTAFERSDFQEVTIWARPHYRRLVFELPGLPNLPELPSRRTNLFDHPIPIVHVPNRPGQLLEAIEAVTQFRAAWDGDRIVSKRVPQEFENVTARELIEVVHKAAGPDHHVRVDRKAQTIEISIDEPPKRWWERWFDRIESWF